MAAPDPRFVRAKGRLIDPFALFRTSKSGERDWFPPSGRLGAVEAYLPAVERMVEVGSLNLSLVWLRRNQLSLRDYVNIDSELISTYPQEAPADSRDIQDQKPRVV